MSSLIQAYVFTMFIRFQDFFYVCPAHLKDKAFCNPIIDETAVAAKKKKEMEAEVEKVKQEFEEKQNKKKEKEAAKNKEKEKEKDKDKTGDEKTTEKTPEEKVNLAESSNQTH